MKVPPEFYSICSYAWARLCAMPSSIKLCTDIGVYFPASSSEEEAGMLRASLCLASSTKSSVQN